MAPKSGSSKILVSVKVSESPGPIRLLVNESDSVGAVIRSVIKEYTRLHRLPVLGKDPEGFHLWSASMDRALSSCETIGSCGSRNLWMFKKQDNAALRLRTVTFKKSMMAKTLNLIRLF